MTRQRIQLRRTSGWRKPEGAIVVARPSRWGNPFPIDGDWAMWAAVGLGYTGDPAGRRAAAIALHRAWLTDQPVTLGPLAGSTVGGHLEFADGTIRSFTDHVLGVARLMLATCDPPAVPPSPIGDIAELAGHDLACWCAPQLACHADVLLELANAPQPDRSPA